MSNPTIDSLASEVQSIRDRVAAIEAKVSPSEPPAKPQLLGVFWKEDGLTAEFELTDPSFLRWYLDFGDGSRGFLPAGVSVKTHTYEKPGKYKVRGFIEMIQGDQDSRVGMKPYTVTLKGPDEPLPDPVVDVPGEAATIIDVVVSPGQDIHEAAALASLSGHRLLFERGKVYTQGLGNVPSLKNFYVGATGDESLPDPVFVLEEPFLRKTDGSDMSGLTIEQVDLYAKWRCEHDYDPAYADRAIPAIRLAGYGTIMTFSHVSQTGFFQTSIEGRSATQTMEIEQLLEESYEGRALTKAKKNYWFTEQRAGRNPIQHVVFQQCNFFDSWSASGHAQGLYLSDISEFTLSQCVFDRCGHVPYAPESKPDIFKHGAYAYFNLGAKGTFIECVFTRSNAHGLQNRPGGDVLGCFFGRNPIALAILDGPSRLLDNVVIDANDIEGVQQNGSGFLCESTESLEVRGNLFANKYSDSGHGVALNIEQKWDRGGTDPWQERIGNPTMTATVRGNIVAAWPTRGRWQALHHDPEHVTPDFIDNIYTDRRAKGLVEFLMDNDEDFASQDPYDRLRELAEERDLLVFEAAGWMIAQAKMDFS